MDRPNLKSGALLRHSDIVSCQKWWELRHKHFSENGDAEDINKAYKFELNTAEMWLIAAALKFMAEHTHELPEAYDMLDSKLNSGEKFSLDALFESEQHFRRRLEAAEKVCEMAFGDGSEEGGVHSGNAVQFVMKLREWKAIKDQQKGNALNLSSGQSSKLDCTDQKLEKQDQDKKWLLFKMISAAQFESREKLLEDWLVHYPEERGKDFIEEQKLKWKVQQRYQ